MLRVVTGPFHPTLEEALVADVRRLKNDDALAALTLVVPSEAVQRRLKWLLCVEHQLSLLDVHFLTFYEFALRLVRESPSPSRSQPPALRTEFYFEECIHHLLRTHIPSSSSWAGLTEMPGVWAALWATLKDLKDAGVPTDFDVEVFLEAAGGAEHDSEILRGASLQRLLRLYGALRGELDRLGVGDYEDVAVPAKELVRSSKFLDRQERILYYGFYDLTQVQLDLFQTVSHTFPTTLYFPLVKGHPSFAFAQRFFERYIQGLIPGEPESHHALATPRASHTSLGSRPTCRVVNMSGLLDEVTVVAKEILSLVEDRGYTFQDIGVVARTLAPYESILPRVLDQHQIPFTSTVGRPLASFPFVKAAVQLLGLRIHGFPRNEVMDLLTSPFIRARALGPSGLLETVVPRSDLWNMASLHLGIVKGMDEWRRLLAFQEAGLSWSKGEEDELGREGIPPEQIQWLWCAVAALDEMLATLPEIGSWSEYVTAVEGMFDRCLVSPSDDDILGGIGSSGTLVKRFQESFDQLRALGQIGATISLLDFCGAFHRLMEETRMPIVEDSVQGVQVLDAMAARGIPFRALFVLGLNEKVFPRHIREDAFLRDRQRRILETDLGFKIPEKLAGYDEEKLLLHLLCQAAREHLMFSYLRTDASGNFLVPSSYLDEIRHEFVGVAEVPVPRQLTSKFDQEDHYRNERLTPSDLALKLLLQRRVPRRLLETVHPTGVLVDRGLRVLRRMERTAQGLGHFDGMTGPLEIFWAARMKRGMSPTALQEYATCPFRYFAGRVLGLAPSVVAERIDQIGPVELGMLAHAILCRCLRTLRDQGYFLGSAIDPLDPFAILVEVASREFDEYARSHAIGFVLVWELHQERLLGFLRKVLREELHELLDGGWEPVLFEEDTRGVLAVTFSQGKEAVQLVGRIDRIDYSAPKHLYRIVDYKYKATQAPQVLDKNLKLGAVRGLRLQPPLYLLMAQADVATRLPHTEERGAAACQGVCFYYLAPRWKHKERDVVTRVVFPGDAWDSILRSPLERAIGQILNGIREGQFFIHPGEYCERCDYRLICRRSHQSTLRRLRKAPQYAAHLKDLRRARLQEDDEGGDGTIAVKRASSAAPAGGSKSSTQDDLES